MFVLAGCDTCPPTFPVTLGNGSTVTANANTGAASLSTTKWAFYASSPAAPLAIFGNLLPVDIGLIFRSEFGAQGELVRVFDNLRLAPQVLGSELVLDNAIHPAAMPPLFYAAESYGAESGNSLGLVTCGMLYYGPIQIVKSSIAFAGTRNDLLGRADGTMTFVTQVNPLVEALMPMLKSGTMKIDGFAQRESPVPTGGIPTVPIFPLPLP